MANKILNLDFSKDPIMPPIIYGRVGDEKMQTITVKISRRDEIPDLSGGIITFEGEPAGGKVKVFDSENVSSNNAELQKGTFEYTFPSAAFSVEGTYKRAYFSFQKDGKRDTTGDFKIIVKGNADIDAGEAETIITEYNKLVKALNEAYQSALEKIDTDYDEVVKRIETIKTEMNKLQAQIDKTVSDAETRIAIVTSTGENRINAAAKNAETTISAIGKTVTDAMNSALEELRAADFYTQAESDSRYVNKIDMENGPLISKKEVINTQDWNEVLNKGIYTVFGASGANRPYLGAAYGVLVVYADNTFVNQTYVYKGETYIRSRQGSPASWTDWNKMTVDNGQFNKFVYKQSGSPDTNVVSQLEVTCIRIGNVVTCHIRVNVAKTDTEPKNNVLLMIPEGFRATYATGAEDLGAIWNIPFAVNSTATPSTQKVVKMHLEPGNNDYPNRVTFMSGQFGNQYGVCTWTTDDPYPKTGNVGLGKVTKLTANSDGSFTK
ncbi:BppU family phage baseplate upper protein [Enterococcus faecalis]|nr:BppU family phage baseplate upper protein [Enterococcus faecalis]